MQTRRTRLAIALLLALATASAAQTLPAVPAPATGEPPAVPPVAPLVTPPAPDATAVPPATAVPSAAATAPPTRPAFTTTRPATTLSTKVKFQFKDTPIDSILEYLATSFGFIVVKDRDVRITGRITVMSPTDVNAEEAIQALDSVLKNQTPDYTIIRNEKVLRVMERNKAKRITPVHFGNKAEDIKASDELITQVIPLTTVEAVRLRQDLASMFSAEADVSANAASNTLVITDTSINIKRIVEIVSAMDTQIPTATELKVYKLQYANAAAAAKLITDIFVTDTAAAQGQTRGGRQGGGRGGFGGGGGFGGFTPGGAGIPGATPDAPARAGKVTVSSDDRTNTVVVTASKETLAAIKIVIDQIDSDPTLETEFFVYPLKNANALNLEGVLNGLFGNSSTSRTGTTGTTRATGFQPLGTSTTGVGGGRTGGLGGSTGGRTTGSTSAFGTTGGRTGATSRTGSTSGTGSRTGSAGNDLAGQAFVVAEPDTNSLLVTAKTSYAKNVRDLISKLDRDVPQVLIKVLVCEVTHTNSSDIGVEYSVLNQRQIPALAADGTPTTTVGGTNGGTAFGITRAIAAAAASGTAGGLVASVVEENLAAALRALATTGKLDVLSRPSILASDNQLASIMVGQLVPIITASTTSALGNVNNSVQYQQVGIILNVTPHINPDGLVILDVAPTVSQLSAQTVTVSPGVNVPVIDQRQAQTRVAIRNGQTIIIGGLMQDQKTETTNKIPLLGDIPWVGQLFSHTIKSKTKTELLIFLTPQVALNPDLLPGMSRDEKQATQLVPNAVAPGTFDEHMQGMSRGAAKDRTNEHTSPFNVVPPRAPADPDQPAPDPRTPNLPATTPQTTQPSITRPEL